MIKNIALFIDGTWNRPVGSRHPSEADTNVVKLYRAALKRSPSQISRYLAGVGTKKGQHLRGGFGGFGTAARIKRAYKFLSKNYNRGDRVFLFGFSRGAFAARSLAGFVDCVGLLLRNEVNERNIAKAYKLYMKGVRGNQSRLREFLREMTGAEEPDAEKGTTLPIYFIGVWDTVAALGFPFGPVWLKDFSRRRHDTELPANVTHARHALALHELRRSFEPVLWTKRRFPKGTQTIRQTWFAGAHADVGGGYRETGLSDAALEWMMEESAGAVNPMTGATEGLLIAKPPKLKKAVAPLHHEIHGKYFWCKPTTRPQLVSLYESRSPAAETFTVHPSVLMRLQDRQLRAYDKFPEVRRTLWNVKPPLLNADKLSLQWHLEVNAQGWWNGASPETLDESVSVVTDFAYADGPADEESKQRFQIAFCLLVLCRSDEALSIFWRDAKAFYQRENVLPLAASERLAGLADALSRCIEILSPQWSAIFIEDYETIRKIYDADAHDMRLRRDLPIRPLLKPPQSPPKSLSSPDHPTPST